MSTDARRSGTRRERSRRRRGRRFLLPFLAVLGALAVVAVTGAAVAVAIGPRVTQVQVDPSAAIAASGSRVIFTASQSVDDVDAAQVTVEPEVPFAVDTSGRNVGVRFLVPLFDETEYTVTIDGVQGIGGGTATTFQTSFETPALELFVLQRGDDEDTIYRTDLTGTAGVPVYSAPHIEDFRATSSHLVVAVGESAEDAALIATDLDGENAQELSLPGDGVVSSLQAADQGERIGYTFSDADLGADGGQESVLYTASLAGADIGDDPVAVAIPGDETRVANWRFVPDTSSILVLTYDGRLLLSDAEGGGSTPLGNASDILDIARGSSEAVILRPDGLIALDLNDASESDLVVPTDDLGPAGHVVAVPGEESGTLRTTSVLDDDGSFLSARVSHVAADGTVTTLYDAGSSDAIVDTCASPSGRYAAVLVAPDAVSNPYDSYRMPLPENLQTHVIDIATGDEVVALNGFDASWCLAPPA